MMMVNLINFQIQIMRYLKQSLQEFLNDDGKFYQLSNQNNEIFKTKSAIIFLC